MPPPRWPGEPTHDCPRCGWIVGPLHMRTEHYKPALRILIRDIPRFWCGPPDGEDCDACEEVVTADQLLMEGISTLSNEGIQMHVLCFSIWDEERDVPGRD